MGKKATNDQEHIIDALKRGDYKYVWEQVKYIGYANVPNINTRYMIFYDIVEDFDYENNNNFIYFYKARLKYYSADELSTFYVSRNRTIINKLKQEYISPTECKKSKITNILRKWSN